MSTFPVSQRQSKWGRHCCRPHSHRCVVFFSGEPSGKRLTVDVSSPNGLEDFVTEARIGIRFCFPAYPDSSRRSPSSHFPHSSDTETIHPSRLLFSMAGFRLGVLPPSISNQVPGLSSGSAIAFSSGNYTHVRQKPSACPVSKTAWTITTASKVLKALVKSTR